MKLIGKSLVAAALLAVLAACGQAETQKSPSEEQVSTASSAHDMHAIHGNNTKMPSHSAEYMQSMGKMHDEMVKAAQKADADVAFVEGMIPHHQGAIEMAKIELKYGRDPAMKKLAQEIIDAQQKEIGFMQNWLDHAANKEQVNPQSEHAKAYLADMGMHDKMMAGVHHENADAAFALGMIPHHQGAIEMAKIELKYGKDEQIKQLAQAIINAQDPEIQLMTNWLKAQGIQP